MAGSPIRKCNEKNDEIIRGVDHSTVKVLTQVLTQIHIIWQQNTKRTLQLDNARTRYQMQLYTYDSICRATELSARNT